MEAWGISLFLYLDMKKGFRKVASKQYRVESGPHKDVPHMVLKRRPWVKAVIQRWLIIFLSSRGIIQDSELGTFGILSSHPFMWDIELFSRTLFQRLQVLPQRLLLVVAPGLCCRTLRTNSNTLRTNEE